MTGGFIALLAIVLLQLRTDLPHDQLVEQYGQPPSQFITVGEQSVHVRDQGNGPPIILLHGLSASLYTWQGWTDELADSYRVISLDLPGFGLTGIQPDDDYSVNMYVNLIDAIADSLKLDSFVIAGNSFGGMIAWRYALTHQQCLNGLILVDAAGYPKDSWPFLFAMARLPGVRHLFTYMSPRWLVRSGLNMAYGPNEIITKETVTLYQDLLRHEGNRRANLAVLNGLTEDQTGQLDQIKIPVLILWGEDDKVIPVENAEWFARDIPHAKTIIYENTGHLPMEERPHITAEDAREFLESLAMD